MISKEFLEKMFEFHGHRCWGSSVGLRAGVIALERLNSRRSGAKEIVAILETGYNHAAGCFGDGVQFATGATTGKGNLIRRPRGKLAFTVIDTVQKRQIRIALNPKILQKISATNFMKKRAAGVPPTEIPEKDIDEVVDLVLNSPEEETLIIGKVEESNFPGVKEVMGFGICEICGENVARAYLRLIPGGQPGEFKKACINCAGYEETFDR